MSARAFIGVNRVRNVIIAALLLSAIGVSSGCSLAVKNKDASGSSDFIQAKQAYESGKFAAAERELRAVVRRDSDNVDARKTLALALAAQGDNKAAISQYQAILKIDPKNHTTLYRLATLERIVGDLKMSAIHLQRAVNLKPENPSYVDELARTKMALGQYQQAATLWGSLLKMKSVPKDSHKQILLLQAQAYQSSRDTKRAKAALEKALKLDPNDKALSKQIASTE